MSAASLLQSPIARRRALWLLALAVILIFYASFYPFTFSLTRMRAALTGPFDELLPWGFSSRGDRVGNLLFYLPFGAVAAYAAPANWGAVRSALGAVLLAALLSFGVELAQWGTRLRVPNRVDLVMNMAGAALGAAPGAWLRDHAWPFGRPILRHTRPEPVALVLLGLWVAFHAFPFMPRLSFWKAWRAMQPLREIDVAIAGTIAFAAGYLIVASAIRRLVIRDSYFRVLGIAIAASLVMRLVFTSQWLTPAEGIGLALAIPAAIALRDLPRARAFRYTVAFAAAAFAYALVERPAPYWNDAVIYLERAFMVLGILWLTAQAGWSLRIATVGLAIIAGVLGGLPLSALAIVAAFGVHAGRVFHEPARSRG